MDTYIPVYYEVKAEQYDGSRASAISLKVKASGAIILEEFSEGGMSRHHLSIHTLEGIMRVSPGDYVVCGVNGEWYPCKPEIFEKKHKKLEPVNKFMGSFDNL